MNSSIYTLGVLAGLTTLSSLSAQTTKVVPAGNTIVEGSVSSVYPFGYSNPRSQQIWLGSSITQGTAVLNGISYRIHNANRTGTLTGQSYTGVTFAIGTTTVSPAAMSTTFASNVTSPLTTVVSGNWNLPSQPAPGGTPAPFNIDFSFSAPYIFIASNGDLLFDMTQPGTISKYNHFVDAEYSTNQLGAAVPYGTSGSFSSSETFALTANTATLTPGGTLDVVCGSFNNSYTGNLVIGLSNSTWSGAPLPLDLNLIGAPQNYLYVSMDLQLGFNTAKSTSGYESTFKTAIPNTPIYPGLTFYAQAYYADTGANYAGLVTTHGLALTVANPNSGPETQQVGNYDSQATTGNYAFGTSKTGGPVARFTGSF